MTYFLDTNICVYALKGKGDRIARRMSALSPSQLAVASMVEAELLLGAAKSDQPDRTLQVVRRFLAVLKVVPFDSDAAAHYARVRAHLERRGRPIGANDYVIAATVLAAGGTLVSANVKEFERVPGLALENWATN